VVERLSYDAWGKRRFANGADDPTGSITSETTRGFTGQEELSVSGLVHLNGRVYDPLLARFTSPDTTTESPFDPQDWNRYSYVGNDPLAFTDPSGHCFLGCFWQHIASAITSAVNAVTHFIATNPIVRAVVQIGATVLLNAVLPGLGLGLTVGSLGLAAAAAAGGAAIATGLSAGNLGQILSSAAIAGATAAAFFEVGDLTGHTPTLGTAQYAENVAGHALVGCASSAASGGSCESGALSGAVTAAAGPLINGQSFGVALAENAVLGGAASVAGGGKFANGAITGAFGYLFNACGGPHGCAFLGGAIGTGAGIIAAAGCDYGTAGVCVAANGGIIGVFGSGLAAIGAGLDILGNTLTGTIYNADTLKPGPYAGDSIKARGPDRDFTPEERDQINEIGGDTGCHTCGSIDPGTQSGNFIPDHQPPSALNPNGATQRLYPQCLSCSRIQGGQVRAATSG
jgi:RHS repeat-associated protein